MDLKISEFLSGLWSEWSFTDSFFSGCSTLTVRLLRSTCGAAVINLL